MTINYLEISELIKEFEEKFDVKAKSNLFENLFSENKKKHGWYRKFEKRKYKGCKNG